jgi:hypothetical protein
VGGSDVVLYLGPFLLVAGLLLNPRSVAAGSSARLDVRVPNERDHASRRITWTATSKRFWIAPSAAAASCRSSAPA